MQNKLVSWVMENIEDWRDHRDLNYLEDWREYERLWRGEWAAGDKTRDSERSRITSPALQQAIDNHAAEVEEAVFGQGGNFFDIEDDEQDQDKSDVEYLKKYMKECFKKSKVRKSIDDIILLGSIYGTGIGELSVKKMKVVVPATEAIEGVDASIVGTQETEKVQVTLKAIVPQNFLIDPTATTVDDALGVAIEEFVPAHTVATNIKSGIYTDVKLISSESVSDEDLETSWIEQDFEGNKIRVVRYYGKVPKHLLEESKDDGEIEEILPAGEDSDNSSLMKDYGDLVEAIIVIADGEHLLKAEENPYMMEDRPVIAYQDDSIPGKFWGRGIAEKGYSMQKAIDAQIRSHIDSLALTTAPMMAIDATRLPRGSKFEIRPGKSILTSGNPAEILMPFKFGVTDPSNIDTANKFESMLLQATGTMDSQAMQAIPAGGGEVSITLSSLIKKNKRTLVNFQDAFLIPFIEKAAYRFMQFDSDKFPVKDFSFVASSSLGTLAREVEQMQLINLMKTLGPTSPILPMLMQGVITNSSLPNKQDLLKQLAESSQPNPEDKQKEAEQEQLQKALVTTQIQEIASKAQKQQAEAQQTAVETQFYPQEIQAKLTAAISTNLTAGEADDKEFERRAKLSELMFKEKALVLKEKDMQQNLDIVKMQTQASNKNDVAFKDALS